MNGTKRIALFMDYENLVGTLRNKGKKATTPFGNAIQIDFPGLIEALEAKYGLIRQDDFIAVANFTHFDSQKGGLNQVARLVHVDSFESRTIRSEKQSSPGKKYVMENVADMRLAYEIGCHVTANPASTYIICSGDKAFAAIGRAIVASGFEVIFLFPDEFSAAIILKEEFHWEVLGDYLIQNDPTTETLQKPKKKTKEPTDVLLNVISQLRQEFTTPIPLSLIKAMAGVDQADLLIDRALSEGKIDLWESPEKVPCISRREERLAGKVIPQPVRPEFLRKTEIIWIITNFKREVSEPTIPGWRKLIRQRGNFSNNQAKQILEGLFKVEIFRAGALTSPEITTEKVIRFLKLEIKL